MTTEADVIAAITLGAGTAPVYRTHAPQQDDGHPSVVPFVIFERDVYEDQQFGSFCFSGEQIQNASYVIDSMAYDYETARTIMRAIIDELKKLNLTPESVVENWEPVIRIYRVTSSFSHWESGALTALN